MKEFNNDLASIPYNESQHATNYEGYYHSHVHMLVRYIGLPFRSEDATSRGRTDMYYDSKTTNDVFESGTVNKKQFKNFLEEFSSH